MGVTNDQYRVAIGIFDGRPKQVGSTPHRSLSSKFLKFWVLYLMTNTMQLQVDPWIIFILIISGDIEINPGPRTQGNITICNVNLRSINAIPRETYKISRFSAFKNALAGNYDVITVTESWLKPEHPDHNYDLPGYSGPYRLDRPDGTGYGGVAAWVTDTIASKRMPHLEEIDHETMWLMINNKSQQVLIAISYRQKEGIYAPTYWAKLQSGYDKAVATKYLI